ncbi:doublecortin domain-containing protein 1 [Rhinophrynus dorsalis]
MEEFLDVCTSKLNLGSPAKWVYDISGQRIEELKHISLLDKCLQNSITHLRGPVWVSKGEGFSPTGVKIYIQGVLTALRQRLISAQGYFSQLEHFMNGLTHKITQKEILSMTEEELYTTHEEVNELIDELKTVIKTHKGQLSAMAPQLQAEREQCAAYIYQHIKDPPSSAVLPQGLHLKVFENGRDTGGALIYISYKELQGGSVQHSKDMMQKLLQTIHQRLQCSADFSLLGLRPSRLFDEKGQEIKNPLSLQNEQKIWVSYGEEYRPPVDSVLNLIFDKVTFTEEAGTRIIYKALMDPDVSLPGYDSWNLCPRFPDNVSPTNLQTLHNPEIVDADSLFLQSKVDFQLVLHPSIMVEKRAVVPGRLGRNGQTDHMTTSTLLPCNTWAITKAGMILSRALPQVCLAVGHAIDLKNEEGQLLQGYRLALQKRARNDNGQLWGFGNKGSIFSKAYPDFVLTYVVDLNVREVVTQAEDHFHQASWHLHNNGNGSLKETDASHLDQHLLSRTSDAQCLPAGDPGEQRQLTVALLRKLEEKHPKASAQRWAIKHEGTSKLGQWKRSKVDNPLWNKLTYMWPVLQNGEINEDFDWPLLGSLIPNSPPLEKPHIEHPDTHTPMRLKVLRNGDYDQRRACLIVGPNVSNMLKKRGVSPSTKKGLKQIQEKDDPNESDSLKVDRIEFQQFLERCTLMMNLPSAARRLFNENGTEIFRLRDIERDQLVYASCGEQWIDPQLSASEHKKHLLLNNLASDVSLIRNYCSMRNPDNLVLEICGEIVAGAKLWVNYHTEALKEENIVTANEESKCEDAQIIVQESDFDDLDSHSRSHRRVDALFTNHKYPWQQVPQKLEENDNVVIEELALYKETDNYGYKRHVTKWQQVHRQQFEFVDGQIVCCAFPGLAVGVAGAEVHAGVEVLLVERKPDDINQRWKYIDESRTFHLASNSELVLATAMPKVYPGVKEADVKYPECPVILQKYKEHVNGAANQKWQYAADMNMLSAFYSDQLDKEITAANQASVCTFTITSDEEINQPGFSLRLPNDKEEIVTCLSCARTMRGKLELVKSPFGTTFSCATGRKDLNLNPLGPFKCLHVAKTDLSRHEAHNTLTYLEGILSELISERFSPIASREISAARCQRALKIKAYKNGTCFKNGKLIIAGTFLELLAMCTKELNLPRPASKLYTIDGTMILTLSSLAAWAVNDFFKHHDEQIRHKTSNSDKTDEPTIEEKSAITHVSPEDLNNMDEYVLSIILRNPIEVWVSCGEPFLSLHALQKSEKQEKMHWLQKEKILTDLNTMKHKMRHLQGRRVKSLAPASMVPTNSPVQPVLVEGGWTEETKEELKLMKDIQNVEMHLSNVQALYTKRQPVPTTNDEANQKALYSLPAMKRVLVYLNGSNAEQAIFAWGKTLEELLDNCTSRLNMQHQPAKVLYTLSGEEVNSWNDIEKDMVLCVSPGEPFLSKTASRQKIEVRAKYARMRRKYGPEATDVIISSPKSLSPQVQP